MQCDHMQGYCQTPKLSPKKKTEHCNCPASKWCQSGTATNICYSRNEYCHCVLAHSMQHLNLCFHPIRFSETLNFRSKILIGVFLLEGLDSAVKKLSSVFELYHIVEENRRNKLRFERKIKGEVNLEGNQPIWSSCQCPSSLQGTWTRLPLRVPSNSNNSDSIILS